MFPFNRMFLPEVYGLEVVAPLADVTVESVKDGLLGKRIVLAIRGPRPRRFELWLKERDGFRAALEGGRPVGAVGCSPRVPPVCSRIFVSDRMVWRWPVGSPRAPASTAPLGARSSAN